MLRRACHYQGLIAPMMDAISTSETSVNFYEISHSNIPEDSDLHTRRRDNPKSHLVSSSGGFG
jgi:hypothetical protein